jgi:hypothetical protein
MTSRRSTPRSRMPRRVSSPRTIAASRPKKTAASCASKALRPRYGARCGSLGGGQGNVEAFSPAFCRPSQSRSSPALEKDTSVSGTIGSWATPKRCRWVPVTRSQSCHSAVISAGRVGRGVGSISTPKIVLPNCLARRNSARHQRESRHAGEIRKSTASQRSAAALSATCQRSPGARPRAGVTSRK